MRIPSCHMEIEQIFLQLEKNQCHSLCITATNPGEGASSLAQSLAERYLLAGYRTLLVDLNLKNPSLSSLLLEPNKNTAPFEFGDNQSHYLSLINSSSQIVTGIPIPESKAKIFELRQPDKLKIQIQQWLEEFDKVVIDTSALSQLNSNNIPAQTIAGCCDGTILVVLSGQTLESELKESLNTLNEHHSNLIGFVFNDKYQPDLKDELCREIERPKFIPQKIKNKLIAFVKQNKFLSTVV